MLRDELHQVPRDLSTYDQRRTYRHGVGWNVRTGAVVVAGILVLTAVACGRQSATPRHAEIPSTSGRGLFRSGSRAQPGSGPVATLLSGSPRGLARGQWLHTQAVITFSMDGLPLGVAGEISIPALSQSWANGGATCVQAVFGLPQFVRLPSLGVDGKWALRPPAQWTTERVLRGEHTGWRRAGVCAQGRAGQSAH